MILLTSIYIFKNLQQIRSLYAINIPIPAFIPGPDPDVEYNLPSPHIAIFSDTF